MVIISVFQTEFVSSNLTSRIFEVFKKRCFRKSF
jgi:hypothetical protein